MLDLVYTLLRLLGLCTLAYVLYYKLFMVYYKYYYYTSQGIPSVGLPLPFVNNGLKIKKILERVNSIKWTVLEEFWHSSLGKAVLPPILVEFASPRGLLVITDPEMVQELYFHKNQHMEKSSKFKRVVRSMTGDSILFDKSDAVWAEKRKHLATAFYKDKLIPMMETVIKVTN